MRRFFCLLAVLPVLGFASIASAATYQVGASRTYKTLAAVAAIVNPGDIVEVDGDATYASVNFGRNGTAAAPITIRGVRVAGKRPVVSGGNNAIEISGDYYVLEGLDVTAGSSRCIYHHSHGNVIRDTVVHDCPKQGILGADNDSGSLRLEYVEVHHCGGGTFDHQIYMATDESAHPGAVFRMQYCYVHDANGGNDVKSRAERNEIYYNWIEGALYHELELIGPDPAGGVAEGLKREDSDVVGNVLRKTVNFNFVRVGGDGTGQSKGRYRFLNNTFIGAYETTVFRIFDGIESIEMHNNVIWNTTGGAMRITRTVEAAWVAGERWSGSNNWIPTGATFIPGTWTGTLNGTNPGLTNVATYDLTPTATSPLVNAGAATTSGPAGYAFPSPLAMPAYHPPVRALIAVGSAAARPTMGAIDIGAYERGTVVPSDGGVMDTAPPPDGATIDDSAVTDSEAIDSATIDDGGVISDGATIDDGGVVSDSAASDDASTNAASGDDGGCGCHASSKPGGSWLPLALVGLMVRRRVTCRTR